MQAVALTMGSIRQQLIDVYKAPVIMADIFLTYHRKFPEIWNHFERLSLKVWETGRRKYGAQTIVHNIRWHVEIEERGEDFKINNEFIAYYARVFLMKYPEAAEIGFFELRELKEIKIEE
jgi:hypothetical protein